MSVLDCIGVLLGLLYLWLEIKENAWMWLVGSIMPLVYIVVLYQAGIYADCGMEVYYFLAGLYGWAYWLLSRGKGESHKESLPIGRVPGELAVELVLLTLELWVVISLFLIECTDSSVPWIDGFTTALSVVGMWMLSRKYLEQWWVWFVVDAISSALYVYKGVYGRAFLYALYTAIAVYGYMAWRKRARN